MIGTAIWERLGGKAPFVMAAGIGQPAG
jgi:hypothetical protein